MQNLPGAATELSLELSRTLVEPYAPDDLWGQALAKALKTLPPKDSAWLDQTGNRKAFTSTQIIEVIRPLQEKYASNPAQRFLARIDPIVSHIRSFTKVITTLTNADPTGAGVVWGCVQLVLIVASKTNRAFERILDFLSELSPKLALFSKWIQMFPQRSFGEVADATKDAYCEIIAFCTTAVRHLRRGPLKNALHAAFNSKMEQKLEKHEAQLGRLTLRVEAEVTTANMQYVKSQLDAIHSVINVAPTPRYLELPSIRLIPHSRNHRFFGRQSILSKMSRLLLPDKGLKASIEPQKQKRFALSGMGGSGKTQIALEFTYSCLKDYPIVIWILADSEEKINQGFGETAEVLGMPKGTQSAKQIRMFVLQRLSATNAPYLLCFDNADDLSLIKDCLPRDNVGTILVTTRNSAGTQEVIGEGTIVPEFSIQEGSLFLSSSLQNVDDSDPEIKALLENISTAFHGYPLALAQAAAFIRNGGCALEDFLKIFQDKKSSNAIASIPVEDYHATLFTVWDLSFQSLDARSGNVLDMLVYYDPDSIPYALLDTRRHEPDDGTPADLGYTTNPVELWDALRGLRSQSLIRTNTELKTISIHRFLQEQALAHLCLEPSRRRRAFEDSLSAISDHQPLFPNVTQHWSPDLFKDSEICLPHIQKLAARFMESTQTFSGLENKLGKLIFECASYQFERFHHHAATQSFALAREVIGLSKSPDELCLSDCYRMEGRMFNESGQPRLAEESNRMAQTYALAAVSKGRIGMSDQRIPRILTGLGNSLSQLEKFDDALAAQLEAKSLCGDVPPDQSDAITIIQLNLGFLLYRRGDLNNAEQILRATLDASPRTAPAMYALGNTLLAQGNTKEAMAVHLAGLRIYIDMFGDQHALVGRCAYKVGEILLLHRADTQTARTYIRKAIQIYLKQESPYYTVKAYARASRMLGRAFEKEGRSEEAIVHYEKAWGLREQIDGVRGSHQDVDSDYSSVMFYWDQ